MTERPALALYEDGLAAAAAPGGPPLHAVTEDGTVLTLPVARWAGDVAGEEAALLGRVRGPVLDVGCGPGRHVAALRARGVPALGIDVSAAATLLARRRGAAAMQASVFGPVPDAGAWAGVLLLDGNVGIGGDPLRLLARVRELVRPDGELWVEPAAPGGPSGPRTLRLARSGAISAPFRWSAVPPAALGAVAERAGWTMAETWDAGGRWFARLRAEDPGPCPT
jgi:SAM-dependent methyltransferase